MPERVPCNVPGCQRTVLAGDDRQVRLLADDLLRVQRYTQAQPKIIVNSNIYDRDSS